jgi:hypothetical protein
VKIISSGSTKFYKFVFPILWFGFLAIFFIVPLINGAARPSPFFLLGPCMMVVFGFFLFKKLVWVLVDEVKDGGDFLVIRNRGEEITVNLRDIMNVSATTNMNPPQVTLRLVQPSIFGSEIVFSPATKGFSLNAFRKNEIVEDLIVRVDQARRSGAR